MFEKNEKLAWELMSGLDKVIENTHTDEEWDMYHELCKSIESIYSIEISLIKYGLSGEVVRHVPVIRELTLGEVFDYLNES